MNIHLCILQEDEGTQEILEAVTINRPSIIIKENQGKISQAVLVAEKIICTFNSREVGMVLLSAFYAFNMHYTESCSNFCSALEAILLKQKKPFRKTRLTAFLIVDQNMCSYLQAVIYTCSSQYRCIMCMYVCMYVCMYLHTQMQFYFIDHVYYMLVS